MIAERTFSHFLASLFLKLGFDPNTWALQACPITSCSGVDKVDKFAVQLSNSRVAPALPSSVWGRLGPLLPGSRPAHLRENPRFNRPLLGFDLTTHSRLQFRTKTPLSQGGVLQNTLFVRVWSCSIIVVWQDKRFKHNKCPIIVMIDIIVKANTLLTIKLIQKQHCQWHEPRWNPKGC